MTKGIYCKALTLAISIWGSSLCAADSFFTISNIHVDVTAKDAQAAQNQAKVIARRDAFNELLNRISIDSSQNLSLTDDEIADLVLSETINSEKHSPVRYIADFTIHFDEEAVNQKLQAKDVTHITSRGEPVLVIPLYKKDNHTYLWENDNHWFDAWQENLDDLKSINPLELPSKDIEDIQDLSVDEALQQNVGEISKLTTRYESPNALIVFYDATVADPTHSIQIWYINAQGFVYQLPVVPSNLVAESPLEKALFDTVSSLDAFQRKTLITDSPHIEPIVVEVKFASHAEWLSIQKTLKTMLSVKSMEITSLSRTNASLELEVIGGVDKLNEGLSNHNLTVIQNNDVYHLEKK